MSNALLRLRERAKTFSNTEREVAEKILEDPSLVVDLSIHAFSSIPSTFLFSPFSAAHKAPPYGSLHLSHFK